jgi:cytochrome P450
LERYPEGLSYFAEDEMEHVDARKSGAFDPLSPAYLRDPSPIVKAIQEERPVFYHEPLGCWVISRFEDVRSAFLASELFSSKATSFVKPPVDMMDAVADLARDRIIIMLDAPEHARHRNAMARRFGSASIKHLEGFISAAANRLIDRFELTGRADLMGEFCIPLTMDTIIRVLGIPDDRRDDYRQWSEDFFSLLAPRRSGDNSASSSFDETELRERWGRLAEASAYVKGYIAEMRLKPSGCVVSDMVSATDADGCPVLDEGDIVGHVLSLIGAGHDTTANAIAHTVLFLSEQPEQRDKIAIDPDLIPLAVEEGLRMRGSVPGLMRLTTRDVEICGVTIPAGELVYLLVAGAGHDEAVFPDSLKFDVERPNVGRHLAFGIGRHTCIGSALARLQATIALRELYRRMPDIRATHGQERHYLPLLTVTGLTGLEVQWTPRALAGGN